MKEGFVDRLVRSALEELQGYDETKELVGAKEVLTERFRAELRQMIVEGLFSFLTPAVVEMREGTNWYVVDLPDTSHPQSYMGLGVEEYNRDSGDWHHPVDPDLVLCLGGDPMLPVCWEP